MQEIKASQTSDWGVNSGQFLDDLITGKREPTKENLAVARFASAMLGHRIRMASIHANQERDLLRFANKLSQNPDDLAHYVQVALPDSGFTRMLTAPAIKEETPKQEAAA